MSLHDKLEQESSFAESWKPQQGDEIIGTVVRINERENTFGNMYPILTIVTDDGSEVAIHGATSVLSAKIYENSVVIGDEIGVRYLGQTQGKTKGSKPYHNFRFAVEHNGGAPEAKAPTAEAFPDDEPF